MSEINHTTASLKTVELRPSRLTPSSYNVTCCYAFEWTVLWNFSNESASSVESVGKDCESTSSTTGLRRVPESHTEMAVAVDDEEHEVVPGDRLWS